MVMVAVQNFNVDASLGHSACEQTELTGQVLLQWLNEHFPFREDLDSCRFQRLTGGGSIRKEKMGDALAAHLGAAQCLSHIGKSAGPVFQGDR